MAADDEQGSDMDARRTAGARAWSVRTSAALVLGVATLAAMTALAVASTTQGPATAIPREQLAPLMQGSAPSGRPSAASVTRPRTVPAPQSIAGTQLSGLLADLGA